MIYFKVTLAIAVFLLLALRAWASSDRYRIRSATDVIKGPCSWFVVTDGETSLPANIRSAQYCAFRWDTAGFARHWKCKRSEVKHRLAGCTVRVSCPGTGKVTFCQPIDWLPTRKRAIDLSQEAITQLQCETDDDCIFTIQEARK